MPPGYPCFLLIWMFLPPISVNNKHTLKWWSRGYEDCQRYFPFPSNSATNGLSSVSFRKQGPRELRGGAGRSRTELDGVWGRKTRSSRSKTKPSHRVCIMPSGSCPGPPKNEGTPAKNLSSTFANSPMATRKNRRKFQQFESHNGQNKCPFPSRPPRI